LTHMYDPKRARLSEQAMLYRKCAGEMLAKAERVTSPEERRIMLGIATTYHRLANELKEDV